MDSQPLECKLCSWPAFLGSRSLTNGSARSLPMRLVSSVYASVPRFSVDLPKFLVRIAARWVGCREEVRRVWIRLAGRACSGQAVLVVN